MAALLGFGGGNCPSAWGLGAGTDSAAAPETAAGASIQRRLDVVHLEGATLPGLCGKSIEGIRVFVSQGEGLAPIPFQIDERDAEGNLVLSGGQESSRDPDPRFDYNDVLMFLARDLGPQARTPLGHPGESCHAVVRVTDPLDASEGWAYVLHSEEPLPASPEEYVHYTMKNGEIDNVDTRYYSIHYPWGAYYASTMVLYPVSGCGGVDFLDRLKTRGVFTMFFSLIKLRVTEEKMGARVVGWRTGPVRVVRRIKYWADLGLGLRSPRFVADIHYYDTYLSAPITTRIPVRLDLFFTQAYGEVGSDYNRNAYGMIFKNSNNPEGTLVDGRMSPQELRLNLCRDEWRLLTGAQGTLFRGRIPDIEMMPEMKLTLVYEDDITRKDPPESEPGQIGHIYDRADVLRVKPGLYRTTYVFLVPPDYRPGDERLYVEWEREPLRVEIEDLRGP